MARRYQVLEDSLMSTQETDRKMRDMLTKRQASDHKWLRSMEEHPRCAILPSPDKLDESIGSPGSDKTDTLRDYELIKDWVIKAELLNANFYGTIEGQQAQLEDCDFGYLIKLAFSTAFDAIRHTANPKLKEMVFWYYAGHGLGKNKAETLPYTSTPCLDKVGLDPNWNDVANDFVKEGRKVKGGELFLHKVGFCDLYGLLKPWIAAVLSASINARGIKKNKDLVIILDSCYSGIIAQELNDFQEQMKEKYPTLLVENTITIQAACSQDEGALGGYFTPCFVYLNDPKNENLLNKLKREWEIIMTKEQRNEFKQIVCQSPMVVTTRPRSQGATMELEVQNLKLTLFQDPGFFMFCSMKVYQDQDKGDRTSAYRFMTSMNFIVLDYKLKTLGTGPHAETLMGLFLLDDPNNIGFAVCAHIHFPSGNTSMFQRINLCHHKKPPMGSTLYIEYHDGLTQAQIDSNQHQIVVTTHPNARKLFKACCDYVNSWAGRHTFGVRRQERSKWENSYLKHIKQFDLPEVANT